MRKLYRVTWARLVMTKSKFYDLFRALFWFVPWTVVSYVAANPLLALACLVMSSAFWFIGRLGRARAIYRYDVEAIIEATGDHPDVAEFEARERVLNLARRG